MSREPSIATNGNAPPAPRYSQWLARYAVFGNFSAGRFAWPVEPVLICEPPIVCKGAQGLWRLPVEIERVLLKEIR